MRSISVRLCTPLRRRAQRNNFRMPEVTNETTACTPLSSCDSPLTKEHLAVAHRLQKNHTRTVKHDAQARALAVGDDDAVPDPGGAGAAFGAAYAAAMLGYSPSSVANLKSSWRRLFTGGTRTCTTNTLRNTGSSKSGSRRLLHGLKLRGAACAHACLCTRCLTTNRPSPWTKRLTAVIRQRQELADKRRRDADSISAAQPRSTSRDRSRRT